MIKPPLKLIGFLVSIAVLSTIARAGADLGDVMMSGSPDAQGTDINAVVQGEFIINGGKSDYSGYIDTCGNCSSHRFRDTPSYEAAYYDGTDPEYSPPCRVSTSAEAPPGSEGYSTKDYFHVAISCERELRPGAYRFHYVAVGAHY